MTALEIADLLELVIANYPDAFIKDAKALVSVWEMAFGDYPADKVYRAARHHMDVSKKFPTIADIKNCMNKGELIYGQGTPSIADKEPKAIPAPKAPNKKIEIYCKGSSACPYFDMDLCEGTKEEFNKCEF